MASRRSHLTWAFAPETPRADTLVSPPATSQRGPGVGGSSCEVLRDGQPVRRHAAGMRLLGRADECEVLEALAGDVRGGRSRALVLRGEAGIGKTALLKYLVESASDLTVVRAV